MFSYTANVECMRLVLVNHKTYNLNKLQALSEKPCDIAGRRGMHATALINFKMNISELSLLCVPFVQRYVV